MDWLADAWRKFQGWPKWARITTWVVVGIFVLAAIVPDTEDQEPTTRGRAGRPCSDHDRSPSYDHHHHRRGLHPNGGRSVLHRGCDGRGRGHPWS